MKNVEVCPICGSSELEILYNKVISNPGNDVDNHLSDINYVRNYTLFYKILPTLEYLEVTFLICKHCGLIFFNPRPEKKDMDVKYKFMDELRDTEYRDSLRKKPIYDETRAKEIYKTLKDLYKLDNSIVVDFGGATGYNLKYFVPHNDCYVIDYGERALEPGVRFLGKTLDEIDPSTRIDIALSCHTLEHLAEPVGEIQQLVDLMKLGGILYVEVPFGCHSEYKNTENLLTHINFYSEGSLRQLFSECGLHTLQVKTKITTNRWFRWVCIVGIAQKKPEPTTKPAYGKGFKVTRSQMNNPYYSVLTVVANLWAKIDQIIKKVTTDH